MIKKLNLFILYFATIFLVFSMVGILLGISIAIGSWHTTNIINEDVNYVTNLGKINTLLLNVDTLQNSIQNQIGVYQYLGIFAIIIVIAIMVMVFIYYFTMKKDNVIIEKSIPQWEFLKNHLNIIIPTSIAIFVAISVTYLSSMNVILLLKEQAITNSLMLILEGEQKEILTQFLVTYLKSSVGEYIMATNGFIFFGLSAFLPLIGYIFYLKNEKLTLWGLVFLGSTIPIIPFWVYNLIAF